LPLLVDHGLEVRAGPELGDRSPRHLDRRAGGRVAPHAGRPHRLFEYAEARDRYFVPLGDCFLNGLEDGVNRLCRRLLIAHPAGDCVDQVAFVHFLTPAVPPKREVAWTWDVVLATSDAPEIK